MSALVWIGLALVVAGLGALGWCIRRATGLRRPGTDAEEAQRVMQRVLTVNYAAVATAFLGLAMMLAGALL